MKKKEVKKDLSLLMPNAEKKELREKEKEINDGLECWCIIEGIYIGLRFATQTALS